MAGDSGGGGAAGGIIGGVLSAGGQIGGALLSQSSLSQGDQTFATTNPRSNLTLAATNFDALNQLGFGDINDIPGPVAQLVDQIQGLALDEKTKRRGLMALQDVLQGKETNLPQFLDAVLSRVGMNQSDLAGLRERQTGFEQQQKSLSELSGINSDTVLNRARSAADASRLIASASSAATGRGSNPLNDQLLGRINRSIDQSEETALLQGRFGGFNPSFGIERIADLRADANLRAIEQQLGLASGITSGLNGGLAAAQGSAGQAVQANQGALTIAADQANAANALSNRTDLFNNDLLASGISGAGNALGGAIAGANFGSSNTGGGSNGSTVGFQRDGSFNGYGFDS